MSRLSWVFLVHDLSLSFAKDLDRRVIPRLKSWSGLFRSSDLGALFRRRENLGLQLTSITHCYMHMQVVKACLLKNSSDPLIRDIYEIRRVRVAGFEARWSGPKKLEALLPVAEHNVRFAAQKGTSGLGACKAGPYIGNPTIRDWREKVTEALGAEAEEKHVLHVYLCKAFGRIGLMMYALLICLGKDYKRALSD